MQEVNSKVKTSDKWNKVIIRRRDQFVHAVIVLPLDYANNDSVSEWKKLPRDIMLYIINLIDFKSTDSIGKSAEQISQFTSFIFDNISKLKESLNDATPTKKDFRIEENIDAGNFQFFSSKSKTNSSCRLITQNLNKTTNSETADTNTNNNKANSQLFKL